MKTNTKRQLPRLTGEVFVLAVVTATQVGISFTPGRASAAARLVANQLPGISIADAGGAEGNLGTNSIVFAVKLSAPSAQTVTVHFATADGTAIAGNDFVPQSGQLIFLPGTTNQTIEVPVLGDTQAESDEDFYVALDAPTGAELADSSGRGAIWDDDSISTVDFGSPGVYYVPEDFGILRVYALRKGATGKSVTATFRVEGQTATVGVDVLESSGTFTFAPGEWIAYSPLTIVNDAIREGFDRGSYYNELFFVVLTGVSQEAVLGSPTTTAVEIADNDGGPSFQPYGYTSVKENEAFAVVTVLRGGDGTNTVTVEFRTSDESATAASDYLARSGTLAFGPGEREKTFTVPILNDSLVEGNETIHVSLSNPTGVGGLGLYPEASLTIVDNDSPTRFAVSRHTVSEGSRVVTLTVMRGDDGTNAATVDYFCRDQTAAAGEDYGSVQGTLRFPAGQSNATITIPIIDDRFAENIETFFVTLTNATREASLADNSSALVAIRDDDNPVLGRWDPIRVIGAGPVHTVALKTNGSLWAWGGNRTAQLGDGTTDYRPSPVSVGIDRDWVSVACGGFIPYARPGPSGYTLALRNDGSLWAWGSGPLGFDSDVGFNSAPTLVGTNSDWVALSAGWSHAVALKTDGSLWTWGANWIGQLGLGAIGDETKIPARVGTDNDWVAATAGSSHTIALKSDGTIWAWGDNGAGQLGIGMDFPTANIPVRIGTEQDWSAVVAGRNSTFALKTDGSLWVWGYGSLGLGTNVSSTSVPVRIGTDHDWKQIAAGSGDMFSLGHAVALKDDGSLWAWGDNYAGQLGNGTDGFGSGTYLPTRIGTANDWVAVAAGAYHSVALKTDASLWAWGANWEGRLGIDSSVPSTNVPTRVGIDNDWGLPGEWTEPRPFRIWGPVFGTQGERKLYFSDAAAGSYAILYRGTRVTNITTPVALVYTIGSGVLSDSAPLATNRTTFYRVRQVPISTPFDLDGDGIDDIYEMRHAHFLNPLNSADAAQDFDRDGWSNLQEYLAGTNPARSHSTALATTDVGAFAMKTNGSLWFCPLTNGQLAPVPERIESNRVFTAIFPGAFAVTAQDDWIAASRFSGFEAPLTLAIKADGSLWTWGKNWAGQLGNGTNDDGTIDPVRVGTSTDWSTVAAGGTSGLGLRTDGTLWGWGDNDGGQLGLAIMGTNVPVRIGADRDWVAVEVQRFDSFEPYKLALKSDGTLWAWGFNCCGQLGLGSVQATNVPTRVGTDADWRSFSAGYYHVAAIKTDGSLWSWGGWSVGMPESNVPTRFGADTNWLAVAAGWDFSIAMKTDGTLWGWALGGLPQQIGADTDWGLSP